MYREVNARQQRIRRYNEQRGRCIYCRYPMWEQAIEPAEAVMTRILRQWSDEQAALREIGAYVCTAEHLVPTALGGTNRADNIAAACASCNNGRESQSVPEWRQIIEQRQRFMEQGVDNVPQLDDSWKKEPYIFKWHHLLFVEAPRFEVQMFAVELDSAFRPKGLIVCQDSPSVIYPSFDGSLEPIARERHFAQRQVIEGTKILLENADHAAAIAERFADRLVQFSGSSGFQG